MQNWRAVPYLVECGSAQMAIDEYFALTASQPILRLYGWQKPCLSIGRFQPLTDNLVTFCKKYAVDLVRRKSGGSAILHQHELTYAVIVPAADFPSDVDESYRILCAPLINALNTLGIHTELRDKGETSRSEQCFAGHTSNDIIVNGKKISGNAQVRIGTNILQHGSLLIDCSTQLWNELGIETKDIVTAHQLQATFSVNHACIIIRQAYKEAFSAPMHEEAISKEEWAHIKCIQEETYDNKLWTEHSRTCVRKF